MKPHLTETDFDEAANYLGCDVPALKAVAEVESAGRGFCPDDFPKILFEGHVFYRFTCGAYAAAHPSLCYKGWTREHYGRTWQAERARFESAIALDRDAALMSTSWGMFQIMGFNHGVCGCATIQRFVNSMCQSEREQGRLFIEYIIHEGLVDELREHRWDDFARRYNGPLYFKNKYAERMAAAYARFAE